MGTQGSSSRDWQLRPLKTMTPDWREWSWELLSRRDGQLRLLKREKPGSSMIEMGTVSTLLTKMFNFQLDCYKPWAVECVSCSQLPLICITAVNITAMHAYATLLRLPPQSSNSCLVIALRKQSKPNSISDYSSHTISKARAIRLQQNNNIRAGFASQINPLGIR